MHADTLPASEVCAVVLAGGRAQRMGGLDKGLQTLHGIPLAAIALQRLQQQRHGAPGLLAINANRNLAHYGAFGVPVWSDKLPDFAGPLAGVLSAMQHCQSRFAYVLTVPCDAPLLPLDLLERLSRALLDAGAELAMASAPDAPATPAPPGQPQRQSTRDTAPALRHQPVFCLLQTRLAPALAAYLAAGERKIDNWCARQHMALAHFNQPGDDPRAFANANTLQELRQLEQP